MSPSLDWGDYLALAIYTVAIVYLVRRPARPAVCQVCAEHTEPFHVPAQRGQDAVMGVLLMASMVMSVFGMAAIGALTFGRPW